MGFFLLAIINIVCWSIDAKLIVFDRALLEIFLFLGMWSFWNQSVRLKGFYKNAICTQWLFWNFIVKSQKSASQNKEFQKTKS
jgi:hypothetical protein